MNDKLFQKFQGKIAIIGFGKEGKSTLKFLQKLGIKDITIHDKSNISDKIDGINYIEGKNYLDKNILQTYDLIIKSPGISPYGNDLEFFRDKIYTQAKIFYEFYNGKIISITQTKGKSTTCALTYNLLKNAGFKVKLVGNFGFPVLDEIDLISSENYDFIVFELSSYMLDNLGKSHHSYISIIGNIYEDHLDWHNGFINYKNAKLNILNNSENILVGEKLALSIQNKLSGLNYQTFGLNKAYYNYDGKYFYVDGTKFDCKINPLIPGEHNLANFCSIFGIVNILKIDFNIFTKTIDTFPGLPHRLENIGTYKGITFIDDAISTTPESTTEGIKAFGDAVETIFLGGTDRGYDFSDFVRVVRSFDIKNIVFFPDTGKKILSEFKKLNSLNIEEYAISSTGDFYTKREKSHNSQFFTIKTFETKSMKDAVKFAYNFTSPGKICLLSTASPSYCNWKNFEEKGDEFKKWVREVE